MTDPDVSEGCEPTSYGPCSSYATLADVGACDTQGLEIDPIPAEGDGDPTPGADAALVEQALMWASRRVFMATGYRFWGCCEATIRPCRQVCDGVVGAMLPIDWPWVAWPWAETLPGWASGMVPVWACGCRMGSPCECTVWDRIPLPLLPVRSIVSVVIDGETLPDTAYSVYAQGWLLRTDGHHWPSCQAVEKALGEPGTWSVTFRHGLDLPPEGVPLVASFAVELAKNCKGGACQLPPGIRVEHRDGVDFAVAVPADYREKNLTGFGPLDDWISLLNGGHVIEPPRIYRPGRDTSAPILEPR